MQKEISLFNKPRDRHTGIRIALLQVCTCFFHNIVNFAFTGNQSPTLLHLATQREDDSLPRYRAV
jgi:hypothetical protein